MTLLASLTVEISLQEKGRICITKEKKLTKKPLGTYYYAHP